VREDREPVVRVHDGRDVLRRVPGRSIRRIDGDSSKPSAGRSIFADQLRGQAFPQRSPGAGEADVIIPKNGKTTLLFGARSLPHPVGARSESYPQRGSSVRKGTGVNLAIKDIAEAFSRHRFEETYPHMPDDIEWTLVGGRAISGKANVIDACEESAKELADVRTTFERFRVVTAADCVVIDSQAQYIDAGHESSQVASCDIHDLIEGKLTAITSYNIELTS
jgi:hypothetical protein